MVGVRAMRNEMGEGYTDDDLREIAQRVFEGESVEVHGLTNYERLKIREYYLYMKFNKDNDDISEGV